MAHRLIIKSHHPRRYWLRMVLVLLIVGLIGWGLWQAGQFQSREELAGLRDQLATLQSRLAQAEQEKASLDQRVTVLGRTAQVDQQAYEEVERILKQTQDEMLELEEEVAFYRGIFAPTETLSGLNIADFRFSPLGEEGAYAYKLVLTQIQARERVVQGHVNITFEGVNAGARQTLGLKQLTGGAADRLKLRFRYFQNNEGEIVLPEGFLPSRVMVEVVPTVKGLKTLKKTFDWADIIQ